MNQIFNPIKNEFIDVTSKDGQKCVICYQLAGQWKEETETPFDYIHDNNRNRYSIHSKNGRDILKEKELYLMKGGKGISKMIKKVIDDDSLKTESINMSDSLKTESIVDSN